MVACAAADSSFFIDFPSESHRTRTSPISTPTPSSRRRNRQGGGSLVAEIRSYKLLARPPCRWAGTSGHADERVVSFAVAKRQSAATFAGIGGDVCAHNADTLVHDDAVAEHSGAAAVAIRLYRIDRGALETVPRMWKGFRNAPHAPKDGTLGTIILKRDCGFAREHRGGWKSLNSPPERKSFRQPLRNDCNKKNQISCIHYIHIIRTSLRRAFQSNTKSQLTASSEVGRLALRRRLLNFVERGIETDNQPK